MTPMPYRKRVAIALGVIASLIMIGVVASQFVTPGVDFKRAAWLDPAHRQDNVRLRMADRLVATGALVGKTRAQVIEMLGESSSSGYFSDWDLVYWLGDERGWMSIDSEWLVVRLSPDGRVVANRIVRD